MGLIKASLKNPFMVLAIVFMIAVLGSISAVRIPKDILPVFKAPAVQVLTYYQGMPPNSIEKILSNRIERWVNQATGCARVESKSTVGVSTIKCFFRDEIDPNGALTQVNSLALGTLAYLPPNTLPPVVLPFDPTGTMPLGIVTISNPKLDEARTKDLGRINVRMMLMGLPGVVAPVVVGGKDRTVLVYIDPHKLEARQLSLLDIVEALHKGNLMATPGVAYIGRSQFLLDSNAMVNRVDELNAFPVRLGGAEQVFLSDVGHAEDAYSIQTSRVRINGHQQVFVPVYRQGGASSLEVSNKVHQALPGMETKLPEGTTLQFIMDQSVYVREAISGLLEEGAIGAGLVSLMILLFLGNPRMTLIASLSIPLALMGAVALLYVSNNTINVMTLSGLALAIGPLVDDAIVELENHHRHYTMGKSRLRASFDGPTEVILPVLVATCTTVIVLAPIALMPGMGGFLFRPLALAVAFAMFISFILSRTFVPMMCSRILPDDHGKPRKLGWFGRFHHRFEHGLDALSSLYGRALHRALDHRGKVLTFILILFVGSLLLYRGIGQEFFPQVDAGQISIYVRAPSNSRLDETELRIIEVEKAINREIPAEDRKTVVSELGLDPDWSAAYSPNSGQQDTVIRIQLTDERKRSSQEYASQLRHSFANTRRFDDLRFAFDTGGMVSNALNYGISSPIDVQITGGKAEDAMAFARKMVEQCQMVKGSVDVRIQQRLDAPYRIIDIDRQKAAEVGLGANDVILQVTAALNSSVSIDRNFWIDVQSGNQYYVAVQYPENTEKNLQQILDVVATGTRQNTPVKLSSLVTLNPSTSAVEINHVDLARTFDVLVNIEGRDLGSVAKAIRRRLLELHVPAGMQWTMMGEFARMNEAFGNLTWGLILAATLVYLLLMALFRSLIGPFIIMFTVPLGLIGVLTMLFVTRTTLNVQSAMGVIFLVGIAVNNGVLLVDFANQQRRSGKPVREAVTSAAAIRLRPIIMTFLATTLDLIPMAIGFGRGSEATIPLARAVVGGLLTSTLLTLFVLPILYTIFMRESDVANHDARIEHELTRPLPSSSLPEHSTEATNDHHG